VDAASHHLAADALTTGLLATLIVAELAILAVALVDLFRRPPERIAGGSRWPWLLVCLLFQLIGPVLYLLVGRLRDEAPTPVASAGGPAAADRALALYHSAAAAGEGPAVELVALRKVFAGGAVALDGVSLQVQEGSVFGFLGPNGAGKTTTLRILAGLARPTSGRVRVLGQDVSHAHADVRAFVGFLPDVPAFYKWMTAEEYLRFAGGLFGLTGAELSRRVEALLELAGLRGVETRIGGYSRGMKQRLGVAQALVNEPRLLLLDEPTSALDPIGRREVLDMIAALGGHTTVFFSTHILADVERVCDTVAILDRGRIAAVAGIDELRARRGGTHRLLVEVDDPGRLERQLVGRPWLRQIERVEGGLRLSVDDALAAQREVPAVVAGAGVALHRFESDELSLEDVFLQLVGRRPA
jgi:ABC-2 type transport system ATP-binding protein